LDSDAKEFEIFVSYSHKDAAVVKPIVQLQRATGSAVFRDAENIPAGKKWRATIKAAIESCRLVWVFWCTHASNSKEVRVEYKMGIDLEKDVVPVLMDATPLPPALSEFQWIDMRQALGAHEEGREITMPVPRPGPELDPDIHGYSDAGGWAVRSDKLVRTVRDLRNPTPMEIRNASGHLQSWLRSYRGGA